jgi:hypothetical protein
MRSDLAGLSMLALVFAVVLMYLNTRMATRPGKLLTYARDNVGWR